MAIKNDAVQCTAFPLCARRGPAEDPSQKGGAGEQTRKRSRFCQSLVHPAKKKKPLSFPPSWHLQPDNRFEFLLQGEEGKEGRDGRPGPPGEPVRDSGFLSLTHQSSRFRNGRSVSGASRPQAQ